MMLTKPRFGTPCNGCGVCCQQEVCRVGVVAFGARPGPCPALQWHQGRFWCGLVLAEYEGRRQEMLELPLLDQALAIGRWCDAADD